ncbi:MAG: PAS domain S-box protein [Candidatus Kapaibacterium sp.]
MNKININAFYDTIFGLLDEGIIIADVHNEALYANKAAIRILHTKADSIVGSRLPFNAVSSVRRFTIPKKDQEIEIKAFSRRETFEGRKVKIIKVYPVGDPVNLTESESENEIYRKIINQATTGVCITAGNGDILEWNNYMESISGRPAATVAGRKIWDVFFEMNPDRTRKDLARDLKKYISGGKSADTFGELYDHRIVTPNGAERYIHQNFFRIESGDGPMLCCFISDITDYHQLEQSLHKSERLFREILSGTRHFIYRFNAKEDKYDYVSPHIRDLTGFDPSDIIYNNFEDAIGRIHPDDLPAVLEDIRHARHSEKDRVSYAWQYRYRIYDDTYRWLADWITIFFDEDGEIDCYVGSMYDITDQKEAEVNVRQSEELLRKVLAATSDGVWEYNIIKKEIYCSENFAGKIDPDAEGPYYSEDFWNKVTHPDDREKLQEAFRDNINSITKNINVECRFRTAGNQWIWVLIRGRIAARDETGDPARIVGTFTDISRSKQTELELRESEFRFRSIVSESTDGIVLTNEEGVITAWNRGMEKITGISAQEATGRKYWEVISTALYNDSSSHIAEQIKVTFKEYLRTGDTEILRNEDEINLYHTDGTRRDVHASYYPVKTESGYISANIFRDISRSRQFEREIADSRELLAEVANHSPDIIYKTNLADMRFEFISKNCFDMLGYTQEEIMALGPVAVMQQHMHPHDRQKYGDLALRLRDIQKGRNSSFILEYRIRTRSGEYKYMSDYMTIFFEGDQSSYIIGAIRDVTEKKRTEHDDKSVRQHYQHLVDNINDLVVEVDSNNRFVFVSPSYCRMFGKTERQLLGRTFFPLIHKEDIEPTRRAMESLRDYPHTCYIEQRALTKNGWRWLAWSDKAMLDEEGEIDGIIGVGRDITESKLAEKKIRYKMQLEQMVAELSSEFITTPLKEIDSQINKALREIGEFAETDRSYVIYLDESGKIATNTHEWSREGIDSQKDKLQKIEIENEIPATIKKLRNNEIVHIPRVHNMPASESEDRAHFREQGIKSLISVPIFYGDRLIGALGFDAVSGEKKWPADNITLLRLVANMLANVFVRKESESELFAQKELFRNLVENINEFIWIKDLHNRPVYVSPGGTKLLGYSVAELMEIGAEPEGYKKYIAPSSIEDYENIWNKRDYYLEEIRKNPDFTKTVEFEYIRKDSGRIFCENTVSIIPDTEGNPQYLLGITRDVTPQVIARKTLAGHKGKFRKIVESYSLPTMIVSNKGELVYTNPPAREVFGIDPDKQSDISEWFANFRESRGSEFWDYISSNYPVNAEEHLTAPVADEKFEKIKIRAVSLDSHNLLLICDPASRRG